ncbi:acyl carrier protein [Streptomyces zhihengii]|uniref:acyl carrier protein n=1 Tax=Streptomyces zhihengii TaxID=1818004 RepID=UPI003636AFDA
MFGTDELDCLHTQHVTATRAYLAAAAEAFVSELVASVLGLARHEIDGTRSLADYGLNSLLLVAMLGRISQVFPGFRPEWWQPHDTLDDVVARLPGAAVRSAQVQAQGQGQGQVQVHVPAPGPRDLEQSQAALRWSRLPIQCPRATGIRLAVLASSHIQEGDLDHGLAA